jgi:hypothetical protein
MNHSTESVETLSADVEKAKKYLASRSKSLKAMWREKLEYTELMKILDKM